LDEDKRIRCPGCGKTLAARVAKGKVEVRMRRSKTKTFAVEVVVGAIICPACSYRLNVPVSSLESPLHKTTSQEASNARGI